ncbi:hypothetical protein NA56DRAFT_659131 [Hyaloscypha hepaticicola]|uniref:Xylanolytic transcriptional activator regulatory domain-containing protein n=1 Tax=Hyaloscypha hepaticicola TaxID=2082293 RepID=A0A2J6Q4G7_9HELO|nr:hypothetical protein NA56DRAFT_659131 [Hyaloscypha hepaticicola]
MVKSLMQKAGDGLEESKSNTTHSNENIEQSIGSLSVHRSPHRIIRTTDDHMSYQGGTHWSAILENIRDIQDFLEPETDTIENPTRPYAENASKCPDIAINTHRALTLADVFETLPPRPQVDRILYVYFSAKDTRNPIIHSKKINREYETFWADPSSMSFLWISLLFSVLYIGSCFERAMSAGVPDSVDASLQSQFLTRAAEALVTGGYQKARPYSVEAVLSFAYCKFLQKEDPDADACMVMGIAARLALRMGYHRDPRRFPNLSPFEGELRRRVFFPVETFDLLLSFQAGLPPIINEEECDIDPPRNLSDEDFDEDCTELLPSRPPVEATSMPYFHYKSVFAKTFRRVMRHALSVKSPP